MKTAIVTDSTAYLPAALMEELAIHMIPLAVGFNGVMYDDEIDIRSIDFYDKIRGDGPLPEDASMGLGWVKRKV